MPIYEYRCLPCDEIFEELIVRRSDEHDVRCPTCRGKDVTKVMSRPSAKGGSSPSAPPRACGPVG